MNSKYMTTTLSEVSQIFSGFAYKSKDLSVADGVPVIKIANIQNKQVLKKCNYFLPFELLSSKFNKYVLTADDVLIAMTGAGSVGRIGKMRRMEKRYLVNQRVAIVRIDVSVADPEYMYQVLSDDYYERYLYGLGLGAGQPNVSPSDIGHLEIPLPSLPIQRKIASSLSAYDDLIENNTRRIRILEEMAQSLYREWFVHFRFPGHEKVKLVNSPLGKIPEGWTVGTLDDAIILQRGFDLPVKQRQSGDVPVYAATGIVGKHNVAKVRGPGVVTGRSGSLGTVKYIESDFWPLNTSLWVKKFRAATPVYAFYLLKNLDLSSFNSGAAVPTLNRNDVHGLPVVLPAKPVLYDFDAHIKTLFGLKKKLKEKNENLQCTRDLLLPKLVHGEIAV